MFQFRQLTQRLINDEAGVSAVVLALGMTIMLGGAGLAIDTGLWYNDQRITQSAADSAVYSAAVDLAAGDSLAGATAVAQAITSQYGMTNGTGGVTVTLNQPPKSGSHTSASNGLELIIQKSETRFFSNLFVNTASVSGRAVALAGTTNGKYCILALDEDNDTGVTINFSGGGTVDTSACGIHVNARGADSLHLSGGAQLKAEYLSMVGNYTVSGGSTLTVTGSTTTSDSVIEDPYAGVSLPSPGECRDQGDYGYGRGQHTLSPGTYCNGLTLGNGGSFTMQPGVYIIDRGLFLVTGGATLDATSGVTIVLTSSSGSNYATAEIDDGTTVSITAPTTGTMQGLAMCQDKRAPTTGTNTIAGSTNLNISGALYFPSQLLHYHGGSSGSSKCTHLIARQVYYDGDSKFDDDCVNTGVIGIGTSPTSLVE